MSTLLNLLAHPMPTVDSAPIWNEIGSGENPHPILP